MGINKPPKEISFFGVFFKLLGGVFIGWPFGVLVFEFIFGVIFLLFAGLFYLLFKIDILGGVVGEFLVNRILIPNDNPVFWIILPWKYFQINFFTILGISILIKFINYFQIKKFEEERQKEEKLKNAKYAKERKKREAELKLLREERLKFEKEQKAKGFVEYGGKWGTPKQVKRWKEIDIGLSNNFADLSPYKFEEFIAKLFRKMGYDAKKTVSTGDYGADIIAKKGDETIIIEVKKYSKGNNITPKEVQRTLGAMWKHKAEKAIFITTSDFSVRAKEVEKEGPIELWDKKTLHKMVRKYFIEMETGEQKV
ncbi:MAG: restriction endonuclease [Nanoarchaeota archaeon]|nr:restriction endonuclease [Nanoarchaeota archaeon]